MTIGFVLDDTLDVADGVQAAILALGKELSERGHDVHYLVTETKRTDIRNIHSMTKSVALKFNGNSVRTPRFTSKKKVIALFEQVKFDVLHVQMPFSPLFASRIVKYAPKDTKIIGTFHILPYGWLASKGTHVLGWLQKNTIKKFDTVFAVSEPAQVFMRRCYGVKGNVLPNPVNYHFFNQQKKLYTNKKSIVFVGRFEQRKGVLHLIKAYSRLPESILNTSELIMCGKGPLLVDAKNFAHTKDCNVAFPGFVSDEEKAQYLANADIAVFPSISGESFGIVLAEAMSAGAGVTVGGNNPGYASVLGEWPDTLFDPNDTTMFTKTLRLFLTDTQKRKKIGSLQHDAVKKYDIKKVVDRLMLCYK